ncbi:unnamed protein product [Amoebophrya sp. A120]|nr:unnamed protein product [Amoebophrya sp. A120]|eukprot:GSA120T00002024001.1
MEREVSIAVEVLGLTDSPDVPESCGLTFSGLGSGDAKRTEDGRWAFASEDPEAEPQYVSHTTCAEHVFLDGVCGVGLRAALVDENGDELGACQFDGLDALLLQSAPTMDLSGVVTLKSSATAEPAADDPPTTSPAASPPRTPGPDGTNERTNVVAAVAQPPGMELQVRVTVYHASEVEPLVLYKPPAEDHEDWCKVAVTVDGVYSLPATLVPKGEAEPEGRVLEDHGFSYQLRILDVPFDNGRVWKPPRESTSADPPASGEDRPSSASSGAAGAVEKPPTRVFREDFGSALERAGFRGDVEALWACFAQDCVTADDYTALVDKTEAPVDLGAFRSFLVENCESCVGGFAAFAATEGEAATSVSADTFVAKATELGYDGDLAKGVFGRLAGPSAEPLGKAQFLALDLLPQALGKRLQESRTLGKWIANNWGNFHAFFQEVLTAVDSPSEISATAFCETVATLGFSDSELAGRVFTFLDLRKTGLWRQADADLLERLLTETFSPAMLSSECSAWTEFTDAEELSLRDFEAAWDAAKLSQDATIAFLLLHSDGCVTAEEFNAVHAVPAEDASPVLRLVSFLEEKKLSFEQLFSATPSAGISIPNEVNEAELPSITWSSTGAAGSKTVTCYKSRAWVQQFCNATSSSSTSSRYLHFFPKVANDPLPLAADFESSTDAGAAKSARWHHAEGGFQISKDLLTSSSSFTVPLTRLAANCPPDAAAPEDSAADPFFLNGTYVKFSVQFLDAPNKVCPRTEPALREAQVQPLFANDPRPKKPEKTPEQDFEEAVINALAVLGRDYAKYATELGCLDRNQLLGPLGWRDLLDRIESGGEEGSPLLKALRPALQRLVRSRVVAYGRDRLPCAGLYGDERDAKYTDMSRELCALIFCTINSEHAKYGWRRDTSLWKNPDSAYEPEEFWRPAELRKQEATRDAQYRQLAFESEMIGDRPRAGRVWARRLQLTRNHIDAAVWVDYARFCMRCLRNREEAVRALTHSISIVRTLDRVPVDSLLFMSCLQLTARSYDSAELFAAECARRIPSSFAGNFLLFLVQAYAGNSRSASKYWSLAQKQKTFFGQALPEREDSFSSLSKRELAQRGLATFLEDVARTPAAEPKSGSDAETTSVEGFAKKFPAFPHAATVRALPDGADRRVLDVIDQLLSLGMADLVLFLLDHMDGNPEEDEGLVRFIVTEKTRQSERCRLQIVKAYMLQQSFGKARKALKNLIESVTDRNSEAWILLGECEFRLNSLAPSREAFEKALTFLQTGANEDPVLLLRLGRIYLEAGLYAEGSAMYQRSLAVFPSSQAWLMAGVCWLKLAETDASASEKGLLCLRESNLRDGTRPEIWAWLGMAAMRTGKVGLAKQAINFAALPDSITGELVTIKTAAELVELTLAYGTEYTEEAGFLARKILERGLAQEEDEEGNNKSKEQAADVALQLQPDEEGQFHFLLGQVYQRAKNWLGAFFEYRMAVPFYQADSAMLDALEARGRRVAGEIKDTHKIVNVLLQDLQIVRERGQHAYHQAPDGSTPLIEVG